MKLGIFGASGLGAEVFETALLVNKEENRWDDIIYIDDDPEKKGTVFTGKQVVLFEDITADDIENLEIVVAIGEPVVRGLVYDKLKAAGCKLINLFFPGTRVMSETTIGEGVIVQAANAIPVFGKIGNNVVLQANIVLGHGDEIGDNCIISSMSFVGGDVVIGRNTYIAPHACLRNGIHIGENVIIGMGSVVTKDIPDNSVAYGNPCKVMRTNDKGRVFSK